MNSGLNKTSSSIGKLAMDQLKLYLPPFEILKEDPLTGPENFIIVWGRDKGLGAVR
jgi:hypothetical protein